MIILLNTATPVCYLRLIDSEKQYDSEWSADRQLAKGLLSFIHDQLVLQGKSWSDLSGLGVYRGPGSFTGLRIGLTVLNTLADSLRIPIVGEEGDEWQAKALHRLAADENDRIALPLYDRDANITTPRK